MQASLEAEAKGKAEALRMKKKLEADINELEIALDHANKVSNYIWLRFCNFWNWNGSCHSLSGCLCFEFILIVKLITIVFPFKEGSFGGTVFWGDKSNFCTFYWSAKNNSMYEILSCFWHF